VTIVADGRRFDAVLRLDTQREQEYIRHGGIMQYVLRTLLSSDWGKHRTAAKS
jgi:aconitate hydratase